MISSTVQTLRQRSVILAIGIALVTPMGFAAEPATTPDSPSSRESAAKEYLKVQPVEQLYQDTINELSTQVPEEKRPEFLQTMSTAVDVNKLNKLALTSLTKNFTADELSYMAKFYGSPTGKSIYSKFPNYLSDIGQGLKEVITLPPDEAPSALAPTTGKPTAKTDKSEAKPVKSNSKK